MKRNALFVSMLLGASMLAPAFAAEGETPAAPPADDSPIIAAIKNGKVLLDVRYRFETKEQADLADRAIANTVRTRLGFETGELYHFKVLVEFENVFNIGSDHFNSTTNGMVQYPVIADPDATEINRAQITFTGVEKTPITIGRQVFNLNNQRFVGAVDFRQNQQTFDAARLSSTFIDHLSFDYLYISRVHRVFGNDNPLGEFDSDSHVISAAYDAGELGVFKAYGLLLDFEEAPALSSSTWGLRYENSFLLGDEGGATINVAAEYASQRDYAANPFDYQEDYFLGEAGVTFRGFGASAGYESLGGDGVIGFATPLATLHKFQGFADVFLNTPAAGVEDVYGTLSYALKDGPFGAAWKLYATYHDFQSQLGSVDFGNEFDVGLNVKINKHWSAEAKGAVYNGDGGYVDRSLIWASLRFQY